MEKTPIAEDILSKKFNELRSSFTLKDVEECMIEFAKLHVEQALKEASETKVEGYHGSGKYNRDFSDKDSILNSYPSENIK
jgi:hypothetical protein